MDRRRAESRLTVQAHENAVARRQVNKPFQRPGATPAGHRPEERPTHPHHPGQGRTFPADDEEMAPRATGRADHPRPAMKILRGSDVVPLVR